MFDFSLVFPDMKRPGVGQYRSRSIGTTVVGQRSQDDGRSLASLRFTIGDYLDIAITPQSRVIPSGVASMMKAPMQRQVWGPLAFECCEHLPCARKICSNAPQKRVFMQLFR